MESNLSKDRATFAHPKDSLPLFKEEKVGHKKVGHSIGQLLVGFAIIHIFWYQW